MKLKQVEGEITFYYSESVTEDRGDAGIYYVDNDFYSYILTDRDNIMRCHSPETGKIINITLNNGDFETIASVIKLYGGHNKIIKHCT